MRTRTEIESTEIFWKHLRYIQQVSGELVEAEKKIESIRESIKEIKSSKEFEDAYNYFSVKKNRGFIQDCPKPENGYKVTMLDGRVM